MLTLTAEVFPKGKYAAMTFETIFSGGKQFVERLTMQKEEDEKWHVVLHEVMEISAVEANKQDNDYFFGY